MGPAKASLRGMGRQGGGNVQAPPTAPGNGSGGPGVLDTLTGGATGNVGGSDVVTVGRITLTLLDLTVLGLIGFYLWTRSAQGGG